MSRWCQWYLDIWKLDSVPLGQKAKDGKRCKRHSQAAKSQQANIEQARVEIIISYLDYLDGWWWMFTRFWTFILDTGCQKLFSSKRARPICAARWRKAEVLHTEGIIEVHTAHPLSWNRRHKQEKSIVKLVESRRHHSWRCLPDSASCSSRIAEQQHSFGKFLEHFDPYWLNDPCFSFVRISAEEMAEVLPEGWGAYQDDQGKPGKWEHGAILFGCVSPWPFWLQGPAALAQATYSLK